MRSSSVLGLMLAVLVGAGLGLGAFTFGYAKGWSYFSSDPGACGNCHIMSAQLSSWVKAGHHTAATCNDCHLPQAIVPKWVAKARNGFNHSWAFTFQDFHEPIEITRRNADILQASCLRCHAAFVHELLVSARASRDAVRCVHCHAGVGHGPRAGLGR